MSDSISDDGGVYRPLFYVVEAIEAEIKRTLEAQTTTADLSLDAMRLVYDAKPSASASLISAVNGKWLGDWLCDRFGWDAVEMSRSALERECVIKARLWCGHTKRIRLSENLLESTLAINYADIIAEQDERTPHACYHVMRKAL